MSVTLRREGVARKARFKAALAYARMTAKGWCESQGITQTQLYAVLNGERESARLIGEIDAFIDKHKAA